MINLDDELAVEYLAECREHLAGLEADLLYLETRGAEIDEETVNRAFRAVHSIKGGAGFFGLLKIRELPHQAESVLALIRSRELTPTPECVAVLLRAADKLRELVQSPEIGDQADLTGITAALAALWTKKAKRPDERLRVLLVEDDFTSRLLLQTFLSRYGECHIAVNGREAVEAYRSALEARQPYHLICMDILMPEMDGREAVREVRTIEAAHGIWSTFGARIIMTTTVKEVKEISRCFMELCDAYLLKPIDLSQLLDHMKSYGLIASGRPEPVAGL